MFSSSQCTLQYSLFSLVLCTSLCSLVYSIFSLFFRFSTILCSLLLHVLHTTLRSLYFPPSQHFSVLSSSPCSLQYSLFLRFSVLLSFSSCPCSLTKLLCSLYFSPTQHFYVFSSSLCCGGSSHGSKGSMEPPFGLESTKNY